MEKKQTRYFKTVEAKLEVFNYAENRIDRAAAR